MLGARGGLAAQRRYRAEGRHPFAAANEALARKFMVEIQARGRIQAAVPDRGALAGSVAFLPIE